MIRDTLTQELAKATQLSALIVWQTCMAMVQAQAAHFMLSIHRVMCRSTMWANG